jgi:uncharacterized protein (DUF488 family)
MGPSAPQRELLQDTERLERLSRPPVLLFSVGHGTRPIGAFIALLRRGGIRRLVDVRTAPGSRRNPQFGKDALAAALADAVIEYVWRGAELGGFRKPRRDSRHTALRHQSFRGYADHMDSEAFAEGLRWLLRSGAETPTAFMCAESDWRRCHRRMISDAVIAAGSRVVHLLDDWDEEHVLHPAARIEDGRPVYDRGGQATGKDQDARGAARGSRGR